MNTITLVLGILILVCALFLIVSVLLQSSKNHRMSGVVSGGAETFFGKQKGKSIDAKLAKVTAVIAVVFAILVFSLYVVNDKQQKKAQAELEAQLQQMLDDQNAGSDITTTPVDDTTTTTPDDNTATPDDTTVTPDDTTVTPDDTTVTPDDTTATPDDTATTPDDAATTPDDTEATDGTEATTNEQ